MRKITVPISRPWAMWIALPDQHWPEVTLYATQAEALAAGVGAQLVAERAFA